MKRSLSNALAVLFASAMLVGSAHAGTNTKTFTVSADVAAQCSIDAVNINFGTYDVFSGTDKTASGSVTVACTKGATVTIDLDDGSNGVRKMSNGTTTLNYDLFSDSGLLSRWGTGVAGVN